MIDLQRHLDNLLDLDASGETVSCGSAATAAQYFVDLRLIIQLIRESWPRLEDLVKIPDAFDAAMSQDHHDLLHGQQCRKTSLPTQCDTPPLDVATCAALLATASGLLECRETSVLTEQLLHMLAYDRRPPTKATWTRGILIRQPDCSPGLRAALAPVLQTYMPLPPGRRRRALQAPVRRTRYKPEHVASFLQEDWYQRHFAHMDGINPVHLRRAAAAYLCQLADGGSVQNAAEFLGIPVHLACQSIKLMQRWVRNSPDPRQFERALRTLADELHSTPYLIDYRRRREALSYWSIESEVWRALLARLSSTSGHARPAQPSDRQRQTASALAWAYVTQGEPALAPHPIIDAWPKEAQRAWRQSLMPVRRNRKAAAHRLESGLETAVIQYAAALATRVQPRRDGGLASPRPPTARLPTASGHTDRRPTSAHASGSSLMGNSLPRRLPIGKFSIAMPGWCQTR